MVRFLGRLPIKIVEYSEYIDGAPSEGTVPAGSGPHSPIWPHSLACWSIKLQNSIVAAAELQLSAYMHRKASSAVTWPLDSRPPSHFTTPLPTATRVPDEERSIERRTRRGGRERGEREERREGLCSIGYSFRYAHYYIILYYRPSRDSNTSLLSGSSMIILLLCVCKAS